MTKKELKLEAIKYLENFKDCANCKERWSVCADSLDEYCLANGCCYATPKEQDIYIAGAEFGYNKANEWHNVANDDLPKVDNKIVLCVCGDGYYVDGKRHYVLKLLTRKEFSLFQPVYAWKEIVLPELKESK